jgi:16S rRNA processing protein RimM
VSARPSGEDVDAAAGAGVPEARWVVMGRIGAPFGVQGWVRVQTYSTDPDTLLDHDRWWIRSPAAGAYPAPATMQRPGMRRMVPAARPSGPSVASVASVVSVVSGPALAGSQWREVEVIEAQGHGSGLIAQLDGIGDRDQAAQAKGIEIGLLRDDLPPPEEDEFYWEDLIGLDAVDPSGVKFGVISGLLEAGAHDVLVIDTPGRTAAGKPLQVLVPFVERHVGEVDLAQKRVVVDWEEPV